MGAVVASSDGAVGVVGREGEAALMVAVAVRW